MDTREMLELKKIRKDKQDMRWLHKKRESFTPHAFIIRIVMLDFFEKFYWVKRDTISAYFSRAWKSLADYHDCIEFVKNWWKFR